MKKNQVDEILVNQAKRRTIVIGIVCLIVVVLILAIFSFAAFSIKNAGYIVYYNEKSNVDYKVYLKENDFFEDNHLDEDNRYVASLIDYIDANFEYKIAMKEKNSSYSYSYRIEADVSVKEDVGSKPLFNKTYVLVENSDILATGESVIKESIKIDYNKYNDLINQFISIYGLNDTNSTLTINMYVDVDGNCTEVGGTDKDTVTSLVIPLTTKTVGIDIKNNITESNDSYMVCKDKSGVIYLYLILGIGLLLLAAYLVYRLFKYIKDTRTAETIYDVELKKILNNYHSYIQKVNNKFDLKEINGIRIDDTTVYGMCQIFRLNSFTDMLEIRDSLNTPILMSTSDEAKSTYFFILDVANNAIYIYGLRVKEIQRQIDNTKE